MTDAVPAPGRALATLLDAYGAAARRSGGQSAWYRVAGRVVRVRGAGACFEPLTRPWEHLSIAPSERHDLDLVIWDTASTGVPLPSITDSSVAAPPDTGPGAPAVPLLAVREPDQRTFSAYAPGLRTGVLVADDPRTFDRILPLRLILHWWLQSFDCSLLHAGAVGLEDRGVLITGRGGLGKSTTCVSALLAGWQYLGDDFVAVGSTPDGSTAYSVACTARLSGDALARFPMVEARAVVDPPAPDGKTLVYLNRAWAGQMADRFLVAAVVVPQIVHRPESRLLRIPGGDALRAAVSTLTTVMGARDRTFAALAAFTRRMPCYRLEAGSDARGVVAALAPLVS